MDESALFYNAQPNTRVTITYLTERTHKQWWTILLHSPGKVCINLPKIGSNWLLCLGRKKLKKEGGKDREKQQRSSAD